MTSEVVCSLIALAGTVLSALIAYFVSRSTANKEVEKLKLTWEHEDLVSTDDEYAEMAASVSEFILCHYGSIQRKALARVASIRSKETSEIAILLDSLYQAIRDWKLDDADALLTQVVEKKRESKCNADASKRNNPKN